MKGSITGNEIPRGRAHARPTLSQRGDAQVTTRHEHELTRTWPVFSSLDEKLDLRSLSPNFGIDHTGVPPKTACECSVSLLPNTGRMQHPIGHCDPSLVCPYQVASVYIRLGLYRGIVAASGSVLLSDEAQAAESKDHVASDVLEAGGEFGGVCSLRDFHVSNAYPLSCGEHTYVV
jgi:hypothetical protein